MTLSTMQWAESQNLATFECIAQKIGWARNDERSRALIR